MSVTSAGREAGATKAVADAVCENTQAASRELERPSSSESRPIPHASLWNSCSVSNFSRALCVSSVTCVDGAESSQRCSRRASAGCWRALSASRRSSTCHSQHNATRHPSTTVIKSSTGGTRVSEYIIILYYTMGQSMSLCGPTLRWSGVMVLRRACLASWDSRTDTRSAVRTMA